MSMFRSIYRSMYRSVWRSLNSSEGSGIPILPTGFVFLVDDEGNFLRNDGKFLIAPQ